MKRRDLLRAATLGGAGLGFSSLFPAWAQPLSGGIARPLAEVGGADIALTIGAIAARVDGKTSRAEMEAGVKRSYDAIDTVHQGSIGYLQFADWAERWLGDRNALPSPFDVDKNSDDRITSMYCA